MNHRVRSSSPPDPTHWLMCTQVANYCASAGPSRHAKSPFKTKEDLRQTSPHHAVLTAAMKAKQAVEPKRRRRSAHAPSRTRWTRVPL